MVDIIEILIVEDNIDFIHFIKRILSEERYKIRIIQSGTEAYEYLLNPEVNPDVILLDYELPGMNGIEILEKINEHENSYSAIFLSVHNSFDTVLKAMKAGAMDFLAKSSDLKTELPGKIEKIYKIHYSKVERKKAEAIILKQNEELKRLNADKDRFMQILAHDLRNPFNILINLSELILNDLYDLDMEELKEYMKVINKEATNTFNLLEELLLWSRAQSGKLPYEPEKLQLRNICEIQIMNSEDKAMNKRIDLKYLESEPIYLKADRNMLNTIIRNLLSNALKFTNVNGSVKIYALKESGFARVTISDNGVGMNEEHIAKLWNFAEPYTTKGTGDETGTGLGLLFCKEFVEKHGGKIWIESKVGKGSKFIFTLPLYKE
ncbi:MAG: hybrid sensor histidine kinase/response regulator [Leptospiraceae bacterium]|nr:hybrid sensor histidine kinase/response regulator [Leptospiraceae bacterium]MCP5499883.1 hybrid sensor histidine kinase/response regulator [Leptospiraceae bacterium]